MQVLQTSAASGQPGMVRLLLDVAPRSTLKEDATAMVLNAAAGSGDVRVVETLDAEGTSFHQLVHQSHTIEWRGVFTLEHDAELSESVGLTESAALIPLTSFGLFLRGSGGGGGTGPGIGMCCRCWGGRSVSRSHSCRRWRVARTS